MNYESALYDLSLLVVVDKQLCLSPLPGVSPLASTHCTLLCRLRHRTAAPLPFPLATNLSADGNSSFSHVFSYRCRCHNMEPYVAAQPTLSQRQGCSTRYDTPHHRTVNLLAYSSLPSACGMAEGGYSALPRQCRLDGM